MNKRELKIDPISGNIFSVPGLMIPMLALTEEEKSMKITIDRINEYHYQIGEDFLEYSQDYLLDRYVFGGYLIAKYPEKSLEIIEIMNDECYEVHNFAELFPYNENLDLEEHYIHVCDFANLTVNTKERFNEVLISVKEHYKNE